MMKPLALLIFCLSFFFFSDAQSLSWFHGDWMGETYFPKGAITKRIIVKLRVTKVNGNRFEAMLDNFYPNDTTVRLERKITGRFVNKTMHIESSEQTYILDPRTQNFWRDCSSCDIEPVFNISDDKIEIQIKTLNCGDECDGETSFSRDTSTLNPSQQNELAKWLQLPTQKPETNITKNASTDSVVATSNKPSITAKTDSLKEQKPVVKDTIAGDIKTLVTNKKITEIKARDSALSSDKRQDTSAASIIPKQSTTGASLPKKIPGKPLPVEAAKTGKNDTVAKAAISNADTIPAALSTRTTHLATTYQVTSPHIVIQLFDNAEIDGDIVSVYHNGQLIANKQSLTHKAITITIDASKTSAHHEFIMVADNLGLIPPNTALMRITAGQQKFELEVSSDFYNNTKIAIDYTGE